MAGTPGRILSLGHPLPGPLVDNYNVCSAPSFFDYDALVVDVTALDTLIEGVLDGSAAPKTFTGASVVAANPARGEVGLLDMLRRRRSETERLLERGGVVVSFAAAQTIHIVGGEPHGSYDWLGDDQAWLQGLIAGEGSAIDVCDHAHPLAAFVAGQASNIAYRAHLDPGANGRVFVRSRGGAAIGAELSPVHGGRIVLLPALAKHPSGEARYDASDVLQRGIRRMLGSIAEGVAPRWLSEFEVPELEARTAALHEAREARDAAQRAMDQAEKRQDELARYQRLLWQEGSVGLDEVVVEALRLIGFDVYDGNREALELRAEGASVLLEIEASISAVDLAPHHRLRQRIEQAIERRGEAPQGLLFVNGFRLVAPASREAQATAALRTAAETMGYCIVTTASLFEAVVAQLSGDVDAVAAYRGRLVSVTGLLS